MKISVVTPAPKRSRAGNRATAERWATMLRQLGHTVSVSDGDAAPNADLLIALHAWRSAAQIARFRAHYPERKIVVALTGTDIYRFQKSHPRATLRSMALADRLVCLHDLVHRDVPRRFHGKLRVIHQSALTVPRNVAKRPRWFDVLVVGHLREEKDPLRAAYAARLLPDDSRIRIVHYGRAHDRDWAMAARAEMRINRRYVWRGEIAHGRVRRAMARARLMVLSSRMEGGANVISEALASGLVVIASAIPGSIGLLGDSYPGYYPTENESALAELLLRAEREPGYRRELERHCRRRAAHFKPQSERAAWRTVLRELLAHQ